jgi:rhodanese-related sulfurtransferase
MDRMNKKISVVGTNVLIMCVIGIFFAWNAYNSPLDDSGFQSVSPDTFREWYMEGNVLVVDVQTYSGYAKMHFPGSIPTYAYPLITSSRKERAESLFPALRNSKKPVVLVCPGGVTGAPDNRIHLISRGIPEQKLYILEGGARGYPWKEMMVSSLRN